MVHARGGCVLREEDGVFPAPAETRSADLEIGCWEWRRGGADGLEEGEDSGFADRWSGSQSPGNGMIQGLKKVQRLIDKRSEPGGGL